MARFAVRAGRVGRIGRQAVTGAACRLAAIDDGPLRRRVRAAGEERDAVAVDVVAARAVEGRGEPARGGDGTPGQLGGPHADVPFGVDRRRDDVALVAAQRCVPVGRSEVRLVGADGGRRRVDLALQSDRRRCILRSAMAAGAVSASVGRCIRIRRLGRATDAARTCHRPEKQR
jgi:hypothetical protein